MALDPQLFDCGAFWRVHRSSVACRPMSCCASRLSLTPEYFSRVAHELEAQQLIAIDRRDIRILDVEKLLGYGAQ